MCGLNSPCELRLPFRFGGVTLEDEALIGDVATEDATLHLTLSLMGGAKKRKKKTCAPSLARTASEVAIRLLGRNLLMSIACYGLLPTA